jgi:hypothetical protein
MSRPNTPMVTQEPLELDVSWVEHDAVNLGWTIEGANWEGTYTCQIRTERSETSTLLGSPTITAVNNLEDTDFSMVLPVGASATIDKGTYYYDIVEVGNVTRFQGKVVVLPGVVAA